jgi:hypothetical protein
MTTPKLASLSFAALLLLAACSGPATSHGGGGQGGEDTGGDGGSTGTGGRAGGTGGRSGTGGAGDTGGAPGTGGKGGGTGGSNGGDTGGSGDGGSSGSGGATGGSGGGGATGGIGGGGGSPPPGGTVVATNRYDNGRSGWNSKETILNTTNVASAQFQLLFSLPITGAVYGQALYVPGLTVSGAKHNVVYVGTEHNMIYAFDADATGAPLWSKQLEASIPFPISADGYPKCGDMSATKEVGITSTPAIDVAGGKIYLVSKTRGTHKLHALDLVTGAEAAGSPVDIKGTGFNSDLHMNRPGLLLQDGIVYIAFSSHCDEQAYHGWVFAYDAKTFEQKGMINTTPGGSKGGIWQSGMGLAGDGKGNVLFCVGNGTMGANLGYNVVRATVGAGGLTVADRFQDTSAATSGNDLDLTAGVVFLGNSGLIVSGGKEGKINLLDPANLKATKQSIDAGSGELHNFAFWNGSDGPTLFIQGDEGPVTAYKLAGGTLTMAAKNTVRSSTGHMGHPGGILTVSSNGATPGTGIVWVSMGVAPGDAWHESTAGQLLAYDASDVSKAPLFKTSYGTFAKFSPPMVANGKVYQATFSGKVNVYGLK